MPKFPMCPKCRTTEVAIDPADQTKYRCYRCNTQFDPNAKEEKK